MLEVPPCLQCICAKGTKTYLSVNKLVKLQVTSSVKPGICVSLTTVAVHNLWGREKPAAGSKANCVVAHVTSVHSQGLSVAGVGFTE